MYENTGVDANAHEDAKETGESTTQLKPKGAPRSRKPKQDAGKAQGQKTLAEILNPAAEIPDSYLPSAADKHQEEGTLDEYADHGRRKRRRTNSHASYNGGNDNNLQTDGYSVAGRSDAEASNTAIGPPSPHVVIPPSNMEATSAHHAEPTLSLPGPKTPPKKMMKLNAGGKLSSPGGKGKEDGKQSDTETKRRGRPRKAKEPAPPKSRIVVLQYAKEDGEERERHIGVLIERVCNGEERIPQPAASQKKQKTNRKTKSAKPTHPFFSGKPAEKPAMKLESPRKASASTPGKLRNQAFQERTFESTKEVPYAVGSALLKDRLMVKHPGAKDPAWPDRVQAHVRGLDEHFQIHHDLQSVSKRKRKQFTQPMNPRESVLNIFTSTLNPEPEPEQRSDGFAGPRHDLRLPKQLLLSGEDLRSRVFPELRAPLRDPDEDELMLSTNTPKTVHPGVQRLYDSLPECLSAFDHCRGEMQSWTSKYAPTTADEVLQPISEMAALRDWLKSLTINAVEAVPSAKPASKPAAKAKKKRRRQNDELDDFLVDDDADLQGMDSQPKFVELDEPLGQRQLKSMVQTSNGVKVSNAVLLSGTHGCGKTAAAYAVAKELGFQIFEISSAERRSGRDVVDRVGDMTENHIVRHHGVNPGELSASEDRSQMDAAFQKDLESGRQGKMSAFFKKQPAAKPVEPKVTAQKTQTIEKLQKALKQPTKDQQQSLILLEEVDILFKEDKDFWTTVFKLLASSKRPFIMTCNDEDLVPLQAMSLHAILRFAPPSPDPSIDLMLLIAAMEGHILKRDAVSSLFDSKNFDLRATISELDFWCQMGVGDPKGGLSWIYQRYPPGSDVDARGRKLRIISEDTFQDGMGLVQAETTVDEDAALLAWHEFGVEPTTLIGWRAERGSSQETQLSSVPSSLKDMGRMADALSAMDVYSTHSTMDASLPEIPAKSRSHYIEGMALLESNERMIYNDMPAKLAVSSALLACRSLCPTTAVDRTVEPSNLLGCIQHVAKGNKPALARSSFVCFDAISAPPSSSNASGLEMSVFDGPLEPIVLDLAPYVRSIVQYDVSLEEQRARLGEIMGDGPKAKRVRTTRAARSALEGSQRGTTRRERWFNEGLDLDATLATGGQDWPKAIANVEDQELREGTPASSIGSAASAHYNTREGDDQGRVQP